MESPNEIDSLFEGELIEVTINCSNCGKGKLYLKFAGSTDLCEDKSKHELLLVILITIILGNMISFMRTHEIFYHKCSTVLAP